MIVYAPIHSDGVTRPSVPWCINHASANNFVVVGDSFAFNNVDNFMQAFPISYRVPPRVTATYLGLDKPQTASIALNASASAITIYRDKQWGVHWIAVGY